MTLDLCKSRGIKIFSIRHKEKRWHFFFSFPIFSRGERHKLFLLNLSFLVLLRNIFKAVFILISQHRKPRCVCLILHSIIIGLLLSACFCGDCKTYNWSDWSLVIQAIATDTWKDVQKVISEERECSFSLACIFLKAPE